MKRLITTIVLTTGLAAGPVMADHDGSNLLNKENIGGAIGAAVGGLAGNKIVDGKGQSAATAAGAVGGFLLGKNIAHNYGGTRHRSHGYSGRRGYEQRHDSRGRSSQRGYEQRHDSRGHRDAKLSRINETFIAKTSSNVRSGPGTRYSITDRLHRQESVYVVGKVPHRNWYMVRAHGRRGFVYAPLLMPSHYGNQSDSLYQSSHNGRYRHNKQRSDWYR